MIPNQHLIMLQLISFMFVIFCEGKSVSEFAKNSPESAKKLGVIKDEMDIFSLMKADERILKRKPADNDSCPCK